MENKENKYFEYISDDIFYKAVEKIYDNYNIKMKELMKSVYSKNEKDMEINKNIIDPFVTLTSIGKAEESLDVFNNYKIRSQADRYLSILIGYFHKDMLSQIKNFKRKKDIIYGDGIIAIIKNKHNTIRKSNELDIFETLKANLDKYSKSKTGYYVRMLDTKSQNQRWNVKSSGTTYSDSRIKIVSADKFMTLLTKDDKAFSKYSNAYILALTDVLKSKGIKLKTKNIKEVKSKIFNVVLSNYNQKI